MHEEHFIDCNIALSEEMYSPFFCAYFSEIALRQTPGKYKWYILM